LPSESGPYLTALIHALIDKRGFTLAQLIGDKSLLLQKIAEKVDALRKSQWSQSYQMFLLPECATPLVVTPTACFVYNPNEYPYNTRYQGAHIFRKHYYQEVSAMNGEEERCAVFLDRMAEVEFWARNIERRPLHSFWLQTATDKFYPDFVCKLKDGRFLVVEYKSENAWSNDDSTEKRDLGELWAKRSCGSCLFVMPKGLDFAAIEKAVV
jgi:type III restriction enzyme